MSDPRDWVTTGVTPAVEPDTARKAAVFVAGASIRLGWGHGALKEVLLALGLCEGSEGLALNSGLQGCPSQIARQRHIRRGQECRKCWPGGRQTVANTGEMAPERAIIEVGSEASSHPASLPDPNLRFHERTG